MIILCNLLRNCRYLSYIITYPSIIVLAYALTAQAASNPWPKTKNNYTTGAVSAIYANKTIETPWPEQYIAPSVNYGLNLVLPDSMQKGLDFSAGYDRTHGLPTIKADYFLPIKAWNDKSIFLSPRISLTGPRESFSLGIGFRHLVNSDTLVGFHSFYDWDRPRGSNLEFLKEAGAGFEFSWLPGYNTDLTMAFNAYIPVNERLLQPGRGDMLIRERYPFGMDGKISLLLPPLYRPLDIRIEGRAHSSRGDRTALESYSGSVSLASRNGMLKGTVEHCHDSFLGDSFNAQGNLLLAFDWVELMNGKNPFSAPYKGSETRYSRKLHDNLHDRVVRKHDIKPERAETRLALASFVSENTVSFSGGFPDLPNSRFTVQISQSPWHDHAEIVTDSRGMYSGKLDLKPGTYKIRLVHKPSGKFSEEATVIVPK
jgi:hypothetical protein